MKRPPRTLGEVIREARRPTGSLRSFASEMDITPSYLSDIENDRRVPAEPVIKKIADRLHLDPDDLMALAGRFDEDTELYMKEHPAFGLLLRRIVQLNFDDANLSKLLKTAETMGRKVAPCPRS